MFTLHPFELQFLISPRDWQKPPQVWKAPTPAPPPAALVLLSPSPLLLMPFPPSRLRRPGTGGPPQSFIPNFQGHLREEGWEDLCVCVVEGSSPSSFQMQIEVEIGRWYWNKILWKLHLRSPPFHLRKLSQSKMNLCLHKWLPRLPCWREWAYQNQPMTNPKVSWWDQII